MVSGSGQGRHAWHAARPVPRHALLTVDPTRWAEVLAAHPQARLPLLAAWAERGWPVISRRACFGDAPGALPVGVPLPPSAGKLRIALSVPPAAVRAQEDLPKLETAAPAAPPSWRCGIDALGALGCRFKVEPRCFGGLCWQFHTGLSYLSATSDLDLVWSVETTTDIPALLEGIEAAEAASAPRFDGEIVFTDGSAVNWRELHAALARRQTEEVLVKSASGARLVSAGRLVGGGAA